VFDLEPRTRPANRWPERRDLQALVGPPGAVETRAHTPQSSHDFDLAIDYGPFFLPRVASWGALGARSSPLWLSSTEPPRRMALTNRGSAESPQPTAVDRDRRTAVSRDRRSDGQDGPPLEPRRRHVVARVANG
jgi:hypothetical protein